MVFTSDELLTVPSTQPGVCRICHGWSSAYPTCWACHRTAQAFDGLPLPKVLPLALAARNGPLAVALWNYKNGATALERWDGTIQLRGLLMSMSARHESCLATASGVESFDLIAWIPSLGRTTADHPLRQLVLQNQQLGPRLADVLSIRATYAKHVFDPNRYEVASAVSGSRCLIIDDTWTTGASALAASLAVMRGGALCSSVAVVGRHFDPQFKDNRIYFEHANSLAWSSKYCAICDDRPLADPALPSRPMPEAAPSVPWPERRSPTSLESWEWTTWGGRSEGLRDWPQ